MAVATTATTIVLVESNHVRRMLADGFAAAVLTLSEEFAHSADLLATDAVASGVGGVRKTVTALVAEMQRYEAAIIALDELPDDLGDDGRDVTLGLTPAEIIHAVKYDLDYIASQSLGDLADEDVDSYRECLHEGRTFLSQDGLAEVTA